MYSKEDLKKLGTNAKDYCDKHFDKKMLMDEMDGYLGD